MTSLEYLRVDVFSEVPFGGNPLAVFVDGEGLEKEAMQVLAREMNLSETVFVVIPPDNADLALRIFTIDREVPFAGHPVVGAVHALAETGRLDFEPDGSTVVQCALGVGVLPIEIHAEGGQLKHVMVQQREPVIGDPFEDIELVALALGLHPAELCPAEMPVRMVDTGIPWLLVPVADLGSMRRIQPSAKACRALSMRVGTDLIAAFSQDVDDPACTAHLRHVWFGQVTPGEDPATGSAAGCIGSYLVHEQVVLAAPTADLWVEQGSEVGRPSRLHVIISTRNGELHRCRVGGPSVVIGSGQITV